MSSLSVDQALLGLLRSPIFESVQERGRMDFVDVELALLRRGSLVGPLHHVGSVSLLRAFYEEMKIAFFLISR